jgi:hypothetical protein
MAIQLNDNLKINAGKPIDTRYLTTGNTTYLSTTDVNTAIPQPLRYTGLTVNILGTEFWYKTGVTNASLVEKKYSTIASNSVFVTGATNLGFFSGLTGVQVLPLTHLTLSAYNGNYYSVYNNYFRGKDGKVHTGEASDNIVRRGYVRPPTIPSPVYKSWIWNEYTGSSNQVGWILIDGNVSLEIGQFVNGVVYYPPVSAYNNNTWITGNAYNNASNVIITTVVGTLTTGTTITVGAPVFSFKDHNNLHLRTIMTKTPNLIGISYDESFIYVSGTTGDVVITASNGLTKTAQNVMLGGTLTGSTIIIDGRISSGRTGIQYGADYSATYTDRSLVDRGYVKSLTSISSGQRITKFICQASHGFNINNVIGWSGGTYNKALANGVYDGEILGIVSKCYNVDCFDLTQAGYVTGLTGLSTSITYFLSDTVSGLMTPTQPICNGHISKSVMIADSNTSGWVLPYAGYIISNGVGGPLVKSSCLPTGATYQMTNNDFYVGACCGGLVILPLIPPNGMVAIVADISCLAGANPITVAGPLSNGQVQSQINSNSGSLSYIFNGNKWSVFAFIDTPVPI